MKNNKGFSLVELIIVIAIMAVLIGVMAPQYIKYVEKSRISSDEDNAASLLSNVNIALANEDAVSTLTTTSTGVVVEFSSSGVKVGSAITDTNLVNEINGTLSVSSNTKVQSTKYKPSTYKVSIGYEKDYGFKAIGYWE